MVQGAGFSGVKSGENWPKLAAEFRHCHFIIGGRGRGLCGVPLPTHTLYPSRAGGARCVAPPAARPQVASKSPGVAARSSRALVPCPCTPTTPLQLVWIGISRGPPSRGGWRRHWPQVAAPKGQPGMRVDGSWSTTWACPSRGILWEGVFPPFFFFPKGPPNPCSVRPTNRR